MYDKIVSSDVKVPVEGGYNDVPPGFRELTEKEFAQSAFFMYSPVGMFFRQIDPKNISSEEKYFLSVHFYHFHDGRGFGLAHDFWAGKVRYFAYGCSHKYRAVSQKDARARGIAHFGMCYHVYQCEVCGRLKSEDSSD